MSSFLRFSAWLGLTLCLLAGAVTIGHAAIGQTTLKWSAPGDDGLVGRATSYDVRYSLAAITASNFSQATQVPGVPAPKASGSPETFTVTQLVAGTQYYFAIKTGDDVSNWSPISNVTFTTVNVTATDSLPLTVTFSSPWPNPARDQAHWSYALAREGQLEVEAYDLAGRHIRTISRAWRGAGAGVIAWDLRDDDGRSVEAGLYLVRAMLGGQTMVRRVVVAR